MYIFRDSASTRHVQILKYSIPAHGLIVFMYSLVNDVRDCTQLLASLLMTRFKSVKMSLGVFPPFFSHPGVSWPVLLIIGYCNTISDQIVILLIASAHTISASSLVFCGIGGLSFMSICIPF